MKKILFIMLALLCAIPIMAQEVKTHSVYDVNQSGDVTVEDVTTVVDQVKKNVAAAQTQQYVTADDLSVLLKSILDDLKLIKEKLGIIPDPYNGHEYVDLGLPSGLKWATCNVGADNPEEFGDYFQWASTVPVDMTRTGSDQSPVNASDYKVSLGWTNAPYQTANTTSFDHTKWTKYVGSTDSSRKDVSATNENALKTVLDPEDDAAHVSWGGDWRMPTMAEQEELQTECTWIWTTSYNGTGVKGYIVTGKKEGYTDKSIFLPAAGFRNNTNLYNAGSYGDYWSSSLNSSYSGSAYSLYYFDSGNVDWGYDSRYSGHSVRPVCP